MLRLLRFTKQFMSRAIQDNNPLAWAHSQHMHCMMRFPAGQNQTCFLALFRGQKKSMHGSGRLRSGIEI
jgi:hypothetical protein